MSHAYVGGVCMWMRVCGDLSGIYWCVGGEYVGYVGVCGGDKWVDECGSGMHTGWGGFVYAFICLHE